MDFFDLLFGGGEAIQSMFQLGFIPKEEDFREFSSVEYQQYNEKECDICEPLKIRRLDINDRISNFNCGDEDLNDFILNESQLYRGEMLAVDA